MHTLTKTLGTGAASLALIAVPAGTAMAGTHGDDGHGGDDWGNSSIVNIKKTGFLSESHKIAWIQVKLICSEDVTSAHLGASLSQVTKGGSQYSRGDIYSISAFECSGSEEVVLVPVRRPTNGFKWVKGRAQVKNVVFETWGPDDAYSKDFVKSRTIRLK